MTPTRIDPIAAFLRISETGEVDAGAGRWIAEAVRTFSRMSSATPAGFMRCLHLPTTPAKFRQAVRNDLLMQAGALLPACYRIRLLEQAAGEFERRTWPCWRSMSDPPSYATPLQALLFRARRAGAFPSTRRQYANILGSVS